MSTQEISGGIMLTFAQVKVKQPESQPESLVERVLILLADGEMAKKDISAKLGQKEVSGQLNKTMRDLLFEAMIEFTSPDKPNSRLQKYRLTQAGQKQLLKQKGKDK